MRDLSASLFQRFRMRDEVSRSTFFGIPESDGGAFMFPAGSAAFGYKAKATLMVIAANGDGWDHVSVSTKARCPEWGEMMLIHRLFFRPDEVTVQYGMPEADHISVHPYVLHLWRPHGVVLPVPPPIMV
jgi:hypothetical protein